MHPEQVHRGVEGAKVCRPAGGGGGLQDPDASASHPEAERGARASERPQGRSTRMPGPTQLPGAEPIRGARHGRDVEEEPSLQNVRQRQDLEAIRPAPVAMESVEVVGDAGRGRSSLNEGGAKRASGDVKQIIRERGDVCDAVRRSSAKLMSRDTNGLDGAVDRGAGSDGLHLPP